MLRAASPREELAHIAAWGRLCGLFRLDKETAPVEVLEVALALRLLEGIPEVYLHLGDYLEVVRHLEALHIYEGTHEL